MLQYSGVESNTYSIKLGFISTNKNNTCKTIYNYEGLRSREQESRHLPGSRLAADHRDHYWQWLPAVVPAAPQAWLWVAGQMLAGHIWTEWILASHPCNAYAAVAIYMWTITDNQRWKGALFGNDDFSSHNYNINDLFNKFHEFSVKILSTVMINISWGIMKTKWHKKM